MVLRWRFDNSWARLPEAMYARVAPTPVARPQLVIFNDALASALGLIEGPALVADDLAADDLAAVAAELAGDQVPPGAEPVAQAYAGHQFGNFTMLGDGRAILLGEHIAPDGRRIDVHLKGAGPTPFSRRGDGRAALGPMLREYVISEAMAGLQVPTTRSLAVTATGEGVVRETFLPGAVLTRLAASHLRFGSFQYASATGDRALLDALIDYALRRHDPDLVGAGNPAQALLQRVGGRLVNLVVEWLRVGFVHGVMNTDNMTLSGETIDYGPCAFMDAFDPATCFSSIDQGRRYAFGAQPGIALWNFTRFAEALLPALHDDPTEALALAEAEVAAFAALWPQRWRAMMGRKLGLARVDADDDALFGDLLRWMQAAGADYTNIFHALTIDGEVASVADDSFGEWRTRWRARLARDGVGEDARFAIMRAANPVYIPRNHRVEEALAAAEEGDLTPLRALLAVMSRPYEERSGLERWMEPDPAAAGAYRTFCGT